MLDSPYCCGMPTSRGLPGGNSLFFVSPKKSKQKKGDPAVCDPPLRCGQPAVLGPAGVELELATLRQSLALIRLDLRSSAQPEGCWGQERVRDQSRVRSRAPARTRFARPRLPEFVLVFVSSPVGLGRGAQPKVDKGERLSEPKASSSSTPLSASTGGCPGAQRRGPRPSGRLSFGHYSLAKQRKVPRPPGRVPACWRATVG